MFEFQILRYEGNDDYEEMIVELDGQEIATDYDSISIPHTGVISLKFKYNQEYSGVIFSTGLLSEMNTQYIPISTPPSRISCFNESVDPPRILISNLRSNENDNGSFTNITFQLYQKFIDIKNNYRLEKKNYITKINQLENDLIQSSNEANLQKFFKEDNLEEYEISEMRKGIIKNNMEVVVQDLEIQRNSLEYCLEKETGIVSRLDELLKTLLKEFENQTSKYEIHEIDLNASISYLIKLLQTLNDTKLTSDQKIRQLENENRSLKQAISIEKSILNARKSSENIRNIMNKVSGIDKQPLVQNIVENYEEIYNNLEEKYNFSLMEIQGNNEKINQLQSSYFELEKLFDKYKSNSKSKKNRLKQDIVLSKNILSIKKLKHKEKNQTLIDKIFDLTNQNENLELNLKSLIDNNSLERKEYENKLITQKYSYEKIIQEYLFDYENNLESAKNKYEQSVQEIALDNENKLKEKKIAYENYVKELISDYESKLEAEKNKFRDTEIKYEILMHDNLESAKNKYEQAAQEIALDNENKLKEEKIAHGNYVKELISDYESKLEAEKNKFRDTEIKYEILMHDNLESAKNKYEQSVQKIALDNETRLKEEKIAHGNYVKELISDYENKLEAEKNKFRDTETKYEILMHDAISDCDAKLILEKKSYEELLQNTASDYETKLTTQKATYEALMQDFNSDYEAKIKTEKNKYQKSLQDTISEYETKLKNEKSKFKEEQNKCEKSMQDTISEYETKLKNENLKFKEERNKCEKSMQDTISEYETKLKNENLKFKEEQNKFEKSMQDTISEYETKLKKENLKFKEERNKCEKSMQEYIFDYDNKIKSEKIKFKEEQNKYEKLIQQYIFDYESKIKNEKNKYEENYSMLKHEIKDLRNELSNAELQKNLVEKSLLENKNEYEIALETLEGKNNSFSLQLLELENNYCNQIDELNKKFADFRASFEIEKESIITECESGKKLLENEICCLKLESQRLIQSKIEELEAYKLHETENLNQVIETNRKNHTQDKEEWYRSQMEYKEIINLKDTLLNQAYQEKSLLESQYSKLSQDYMEYKELINLKDASLSQVYQEKSLLETQYSKLSQDYTKYKELINLKDTSFNQAYQEKSLIETQYSKLSQDYKELNLSFEQSQEIIAKLNSEKNMIQTTLNENISKIDQMANEIENLQALVLNTKAEKKQSNKEILNILSSHNPSDPETIDKMLNAYLVANRTPNNFIRIADGVYSHKNRKVGVCIRNGGLVIRVGGGYMYIDEFLRQYLEENATDSAASTQRYPEHKKLSVLENPLEECLYDFSNPINGLNISTHSQKNLSKTPVKRFP